MNACGIENAKHGERPASEADAKQGRESVEPAPSNTPFRPFTASEVSVRPPAIVRSAQGRSLTTEGRQGRAGSARAAGATARRRLYLLY